MYRASHYVAFTVLDKEAFVMFKKILYTHVIIAIAIAFTGCPDPRKLANQADSAFNREASQYQEVKAAIEREGTVSRSALEGWASSVVELQSVIESVIVEYESAKQKNKTDKIELYETEIRAYRSKMDAIYTRPLNATLLVDPQNYGAMRRVVDSLYVSLSSLDSVYQRLYRANPIEMNVRIFVKVDVDKAFNLEASQYQQVEAAVQREGKASTRVLEQWTNAIDAVHSAVKILVEAYEAATQSNKKDRIDLYAAQIQAYKGRMDALYARQLHVELRVEPWNYTSVKQVVDTLYASMEHVGGMYHRLYNVEPTQTVQIIVNRDEAFYDTESDCIQEFRNKTASDPRQDICLTEARRRCSHQMDMRCVRELITSQLQSVLYDRSLCSTQKTRDVYGDVVKTDYFGQPVYEEVVKKDVFGQPIYEKVAKTDAFGRPIYEDIPVTDAYGQPVYETVPKRDAFGNIIYEEVPVEDEYGNINMERRPVMERRRVVEHRPVMERRVMVERRVVMEHRKVGEENYWVDKTWFSDINGCDRTGQRRIEQKE